MRWRSLVTLAFSLALVLQVAGPAVGEHVFNNQPNPEARVYVQTGLGFGHRVVLEMDWVGIGESNDDRGLKESDRGNFRDDCKDFDPNDGTPQDGEIDQPIVFSTQPAVILKTPTHREKLVDRTTTDLGDNLGNGMDDEDYICQAILHRLPAGATSGNAGVGVAGWSVGHIPDCSSENPSDWGQLPGEDSECYRKWADDQKIGISEVAVRLDQIHVPELVFDPEWSATTATTLLTCKLDASSATFEDLWFRGLRHGEHYQPTEGIRGDRDTSVDCFDFSAEVAKENFPGGVNTAERVLVSTAGMGEGLYVVCFSTEVVNQRSGLGDTLTDSTWFWIDSASNNLGLAAQWADMANWDGVTHDQHPNFESQDCAETITDFAWPA